MDPTTPTAPPDWSTIQDQILCPLCDYNLRGLPAPRCPECGYQFAWPEVLDPALRRHPYLFEHHPRRPLWSFSQTLLGTLRPRSFWNSLHPTQPSHPKRLLAYGLITLLFSSLPLLILVIPQVNRRCSMHWWTLFPLRTAPTLPLRQMTRQWLGHSMLNELAAVFRQSNLLQLVSIGTLAHLLWPLVTFALLMIFQSSMRRGRIKATHVLRCVIYSADPGVWLNPLLAMGIVAYAFLPSSLAINELFCWATLILGLAYYATMTYRLAIAYRLYLRFPHATATVLATQSIVALLALVLAAARSANWI